MKPRDFKPAFSWEERHPLLRDEVLFVPRNYPRHGHTDFGQVSFSKIFGNDKPVIIEFCSGNGAWIANQAKLQPEYNWVAVERRFDRVAQIWAKLKNENLSNLFIVNGDAQDFVNYYLPKSCAFKAFVNFPDPWPKAKHAKHRLLQKSFLESLKTVLVDHGTLTVSTDDKPYVDQIIEEFMQAKFGNPSFDFPHFVTEWPDYGYSYFDSLWRGKGKKIYYLQFAACP